MINKIDKLCTDIGRQLSPQELAETLWLAMYMGDTMVPDSQPAVPDLPPMVLPPLQSPTEDISKPTGEGIYQPPSSPEPTTIPGSSSQVLRSPTGTALPSSLELARGLRPLMQRMPSRTQTLLDEDATIKRIVDEHLWEPVMCPAPDRWFGLDLVVDHSVSMGLWRDTVASFLRLLKYHGAFRNVRCWSLVTDGKHHKKPALYAGMAPTASEGGRRQWTELVHPHEQRIILVVSDCISTAWRDGSSAEFLDLCGSYHPTAIVQMLPQRLWVRTALGRAQSIQVHAPEPGAPNSRLLPVSGTEGMSQRKGTLKKNLPTPVIMLNRWSVEAWAQVVAGWPKNTTPAVVLSHVSTSAHVPASQPLDAQRRVRRFRLNTSTTASRLAGLLTAVAPVSLPVIHLVRETLVPEARQEHVAEVLMGGLLKRISPDDTVGNPYRMKFSFLEGVAEELRRANVVSRSDIIRVVAVLSKYVTQNLDKPQSFPALVKTLAEGQQESIAVEHKPFAFVPSEVLRSYGIGPLEAPEESLEVAEQNQTTSLPIPDTVEDPTVSSQGSLTATPLVGDEASISGEDVTLQNILIATANAALEQGAFAEAERLFREALQESIDRKDQQLRHLAEMGLKAVEERQPVPFVESLLGTTAPLTDLLANSLTDLLAQAQQAINSGDLDQAEQIYDSLRQFARNTGDTHYLTQAEEGLAEISRLRMTDPQQRIRDLEAEANRLLRLPTNQNYKAARDIFERILGFSMLTDEQRQYYYERVREVERDRTALNERFGQLTTARQIASDADELIEIRKLELLGVTHDIEDGTLLANRYLELRDRIVTKLIRSAQERITPAEDAVHEGFDYLEAQQFDLTERYLNDALTVLEARNLRSSIDRTNAPETIAAERYIRDDLQQDQQFSDLNEHCHNYREQTERWKRIVSYLRPKYNQAYSNYQAGDYLSAYSQVEEIAAHLESVNQKSNIVTILHTQVRRRWERDLIARTDNLLGQARRMLSQGQERSAIQYLNEALELRLQFETPQLQAKYDEARLLRNEISYKNATIAQILNEGHSYFRRREYVSAIESYTAVLERSQNNMANPDVLYALDQRNRAIELRIEQVLNEGEEVLASQLDAEHVRDLIAAERLRLRMLNHLARQQVLQQRLDHLDKQLIDYIQQKRTQQDEERQRTEARKRCQAILEEAHQHRVAGDYRAALDLLVQATSIDPGDFTDEIYTLERQINTQISRQRNGLLVRANRLLHNPDTEHQQLEDLLLDLQYAHHWNPKNDELVPVIDQVKQRQREQGGNA